MVVDCCAQQRTYEKFFGLLGQVCLFVLIVLHKLHTVFLFLKAGLPRSLKILESPGIGKRKFQALESP